MNLRHLHIFISVAETGSMSETARILFMTQPAISQTIAELEAGFNVRLFERANKRLILTYPGEMLYTYGKRILQLVELTENTLQDIAALKTGKLRIGASTTIGIYLLPQIVGDFRKRHGEIETHFTIDNTSVIEEKIIDYQLDLGLVEGPVHSGDIIVKHLFDDELYLICSPNHHWVKDNQLRICPAEISKEKLILREQGSGTREVFEQEMAKYGAPYQAAHILNNTEAIKKTVAADIGIGIVSKLAVQEELKSGQLVRVATDGITFRRELNVIYHKDKYHSGLFNEFMQHLNSYQERYKTQ